MSLKEVGDYLVILESANQRLTTAINGKAIKDIDFHEVKTPVGAIFRSADLLSTRMDGYPELLLNTRGTLRDEYKSKPLEDLSLDELSALIMGILSFSNSIISFLSGPHEKQ